MQTLERLWMPNLSIWIHWNQQMHYLAARQIQRNRSMKLTRLLKTRSSISTCVHYTHTSASMEFFHWDAQQSYLRRILTKTILDNIVHWSNVKCYHLKTCTAPCSNTKLTINSCFPCVGHVQNRVIIRNHARMRKKKSSCRNVDEHRIVCSIREGIQNTGCLWSLEFSGEKSVR